MVILNIKDRKINLPTLGSEIPFTTGEDIHWAWQETASVENKISILSMLTGLPPEIVNKIDDNSLSVCWNKIDFISRPSARWISTFRLHGCDYGYFNPEEMTVREYGDIDYCLSNQDWGGVLSIVYRPIIYKKSVNYINTVRRLIYRPVVPIHYDYYEVQPYIPDTNKQLASYLTWDIGLAAVIKTLDWKRKLSSRFPHLFEEPGQEEQEDMDPSTPGLGETWGIYAVLAELTNGLKSEMDLWLTKPIQEFFVYWSYMVHKNKKQHGGRS
jgi:hypothetical protein